MAWLPSHQELREHPKTRKLAVILDVSRVQVIGHLHCLWWWAMAYADDGDVSGYDDTDLALAAEWDGDPKEFVDALMSCGRADGNGFIDPDRRLHDWDEYAGKYVERRKQDADRKRSVVPPKEPRTPSDGTPSDIQRRSDVEESREEKKTKHPHSLALAASSTACFDRFWRVYPRRVGKRGALKAWAAALKRGADPEAVIASAASFAASMTGKDPQYVAHPQTWLNQGRYDDEQAKAVSYETPAVVYT